MKPSEKLLYTKKEAAKILAVSVRNLEYRIARAEIKVIHKGKRVLLHRHEMERWAAIDEHRVPAVA